MSDLTARLAAAFPADRVHWRVGATSDKDGKTRGLALGYIDARDVQDRLTEACGIFGWQCRHEPNGSKVTCHLGIRDPDTGEWVWKSDGAGDTDYEAEKGSYSHAFKRAAVKWGVGRYLYDLPSPWVDCTKKGKSVVIADAELKRLAALSIDRDDQAQSSKAANDATAERTKPTGARGEAWKTWMREFRKEIEDRYTYDGDVLAVVAAAESDIKELAKEWPAAHKRLRAFVMSRQNELAAGAEAPPADPNDDLPF